MFWQILIETALFFIIAAIGVFVQQYLNTTTECLLGLKSNMARINIKLAENEIMLKALEKNLEKIIVIKVKND